MATENILALIKCPFFVKLQRRQRRLNGIVCEGIIPNTLLLTKWENGDALTEHLDVCCCNQYMNCDLCKSLWKKYE